MTYPPNKATNATRTEIKHAAQDDLLQGMAQAILAHEEGAYGEPDAERIEEMRKQARRAMKLFGVSFQPGIGSA